MPYPPSRHDYIDSLTWVSQPPNEESREERRERLLIEQSAKKRSDDIDKFLKEQAQEEEKAREDQRTILLLGQAEAGKTTVLKQMRLLYAPQRHEQHRSSWKLVIQLNTISAVRLLLDVHEALAERALRSAAAFREDPDDSHVLSRFRDPALLARLRLAPLIACESLLRTALGAIEEDQHVNERQAPNDSDSHAATAAPRPRVLAFQALKLKAGWQSRAVPTVPRRHRSKAQRILQAEEIHDGECSEPENMARSRLHGQNSKRLATPIREAPADLTYEPVSPKSRPRTRRYDFHEAVDRIESSKEEGSLPSRFTDQWIPPERVSQPQEVNASVPFDKDKMESMLLSMRSDVEDLWHSDNIRRLKATGRLPTSMTYFLDHFVRISAPKYCPNDHDILHARVRTIGITEETFRIKTAQYRVIDVGGSRSQRNVWASFFDRATAIILLAPISAFDQTLEENRRINRLTDSLDILESIVECKLLARVSLILFLNKSDICERKLLQGIEVKKYFPEYTGRNEFEHVWRWFRKKFQQVILKHKKIAPERSVYIHTTVATSTKNIQAILLNVNDSLIKDHLQKVGLV
ncbi:unnamed protein product [Sympodiomycopsis kandeliae]